MIGEGNILPISQNVSPWNCNNGMVLESLIVDSVPIWNVDINVQRSEPFPRTTLSAIVRESHSTGHPISALPNPNWNLGEKRGCRSSRRGNHEPLQARSKWSKRLNIDRGNSQSLVSSFYGNLLTIKIDPNQPIVYPVLDDSLWVFTSISRFMR